MAQDRAAIGRAEGVESEKAGFDYGSWVPYITTVVPVLIATLKVLSLAHWDYVLVPVVLRALDFGAIALAVMTALSPFACLWVVNLLPRFISVRKVHPLLGFTLILIAALWSLATVPFLYSLPIFLSGVMAMNRMASVMWGRFQREQKGESVEIETLTPERFLWQVLRGAALLAAVILIVFFTYLFPNTANAWLPAEVIEKADSSKLAAYVLESGDHDLTAIPLAPDDPVIIRQDDIVKRTLCRIAGPSWLNRATSVPWWRFSERSNRGTSMPVCVDVVNGK